MHGNLPTVCTPTTVAAAAIACAAQPSLPSDFSDCVLWYDTPAELWTEALPVGNGRLGAMVFGRVDEERIQLN